MRRAALAVILVATAVIGAACDTKHGSTKPKPTHTMTADDKFRRDCLLKGGNPQIIHGTDGKSEKTTRVCIPPAGGWQ